MNRKNKTNSNLNSSKKALCQLVYKKLENVVTITSGQYEQALKKYPMLSELYSLVEEFYMVIFSKKIEKLDNMDRVCQKTRYTGVSVIC